MALGLLAAAAVAGCGDSGSGSDATTATVATTSTAAAAPTPAGKDGLESIVAKCQLARARAADPDLVPAEFKPAKTRVVAAQKTQDGFTAALIYDKSVTEAYTALKQALTAAGYTVQRSENEGRDAELFLERDGRPAEVRLSTARACSGASQAQVAAGGAGAAEPENEGG
jgi:Tfp pilus assembly protein FimT